MRRAIRPYVVCRNSCLAGNRPSHHHHLTRVFLYGMLLDPITLTRYGGPTLPARLIPARLTGWRRVTLRGTPWPTLRRDRTAHVAGAILHLSAATLGRLRKFEEPPYLLRRVVVTTPRGKTAAFAWIAPGATSHPWFPRPTPL
jgi:gamma-glutamylcyclotransferase (GGCT)/AIG2-like uncharacterized protein YtfP